MTEFKDITIRKPVLSAEWDAIFAHIRTGATIAGASRAVLGNDRNPNVIYAGISEHPETYGRRHREAKAAYLDSLYLQLAAMAGPRPVPKYHDGQICGYENVPGDFRALAALIRRRDPQWLDARKAADLTTHVVDSDSDSMVAITFAQAEKLSLDRPDLARALRSVLVWLEDNQTVIAEIEVVAPVADFALSARNLQGEWGDDEG
jgi:hypothetical protein